MGQGHLVGNGLMRHLEHLSHFLVCEPLKPNQLEHFAATGWKILHRSRKASLEFGGLQLLVRHVWLYLQLESAGVISFPLAPDLGSALKVQCHVPPNSEQECTSRSGLPVFPSLPKAHKCLLSSILSGIS